MLPGVPDRSASPHSSANPGGNGVSAVAVYGVVPPLRDRPKALVNPCWIVPRLGPKPMLTVAAVPELMLKLMVDTVVLATLSVTWIGTKNVPVFVGVPLTTPVAVFRVSPGGIAPFAAH